MAKSKLETVFTGDDRPFQKTARRVGATGKKIAGIGRQFAGALALTGAGVGVRQLSAMGKELKDLATLSGTGVEEFQEFAMAAKTMGIDQGKAADILKDMRDRIGDFLATGGGPMKDFFEQIAPQVGVTAEQFKKLSGRQGLELFVASLEKANLSQNEMTFYMEAIASDSTALLPLLRNNASGLNDIAQSAREAGQIMSTETVDGLAKVAASFTHLANTAIPILADGLAELVRWVERSIEGWEFLGETIKGVFGMGKTDAEWIAEWDEQERRIRARAKQMEDSMGGGAPASTAAKVNTAKASSASHGSVFVSPAGISFERGGTERGSNLLTRSASPAVKEQKLTRKEIQHMNRLLEHMNDFMERSLTG